MLIAMIYPYPYVYECKGDDTSCKCGTYEMEFCYYSCAYRYTATNLTKTHHREYYYPPDSVYYDQNSRLVSFWRDGTVSFTCVPNSCALIGSTSVNGSATIKVGEKKGTTENDLDGCRYGTNENIVTAPAKDYDDSTYSWTCSGSAGGRDDSANNQTPYKCTAGTVCDGTDGYYNITQYCQKSGEKQECTKTDSTKPYCKQTASSTAQCVECLSDTDCTDSTKQKCFSNGVCVECRNGSHCSNGETCSNGQCIAKTCTSQGDCSGASHCTACGNNGNKHYQCNGTGSCESCVWSSWSCHPTQGGLFRACKANEVSEKYERNTCPSGQTCSGGYCS